MSSTLLINFRVSNFETLIPTKIYNAFKKYINSLEKSCYIKLVFQE